jgi:hypothetical protein
MTNKNKKYQGITKEVVAKKDDDEHIFANFLK